MNTLIMSIPLSILFLYGFCHMNTANPKTNKLTNSATASLMAGNWLAKSWILGIILLMLTLSIIGL
jgi:hypothetical protein